MDVNLFEEALERIKNEKIYEKLNDKTFDFFTSHNVPNDVIAFFKKYSFNQTLKFRHNFFYKTNELPVENSDFPNQKCLYKGLLIIGHGLNGDYIVLNLKTLTIGYVFHDELYENDDIDISEIYIDMRCSLGEFYFKSIEVEGFPIDDHQAETYIKIIKSKEIV